MGSPFCLDDKIKFVAPSCATALRRDGFPVGALVDGAFVDGMLVDGVLVTGGMRLSPPKPPNKVSSFFSPFSSMSTRLVPMRTSLTPAISPPTLTHSVWPLVAWMDTWSSAIPRTTSASGERLPRGISLSTILSTRALTSAGSSIFLGGALRPPGGIPGGIPGAILGDFAIRFVPFAAFVPPAMFVPFTTFVPLATFVPFTTFVPLATFVSFIVLVPFAVFVPLLAFVPFVTAVSLLPFVPSAGFIPFVAFAETAAMFPFVPVFCAPGALVPLSETLASSFVPPGNAGKSGIFKCFSGSPRIARLANCQASRAAMPRQRIFSGRSKRSSMGILLLGFPGVEIQHHNRQIYLDAVGHPRVRRELRCVNNNRETDAVQVMQQTHHRRHRSVALELDGARLFRPTDAPEFRGSGRRQLSPPPPLAEWPRWLAPAPTSA